MSRPPAGLVLCVGGLALLASLCTSAGGVTRPDDGVLCAKEDSACAAPFSSRIQRWRSQREKITEGKLGQHGGGEAEETATRWRMGEAGAPGSKPSSHSKARTPAQEEVGSVHDHAGGRDGDAANHPMRGRLAGVNVIFDGVMFRIHGGRMFGINKMWANILPFMAQAVRQLGGTFTHCQSSWTDEEGRRRVTDIDHAVNTPLCDRDLTDAVHQLPGAYKIVFSSYFRRPLVRPEGAALCYFAALYDFVPERLAIAHGQPPEFYAKNASIESANGYLSLSPSTTRDLMALHPSVSARHVATSPNRASALFRRVPAGVPLDTSGLEDGVSLSVLVLLASSSHTSFLLFP